MILLYIFSGRNRLINRLAFFLECETGRNAKFLLTLHSKKRPPRIKLYFED